MSAHKASGFANEDSDTQRASMKTASSSLSPYKAGTQGYDGLSADGRRVAVRFSEMPYPPKRRYLVEGLVPENYPTVIYGEGGVAKSMLALSLGISVAEGSGEWLGKRTRKANVLYMDFELDGEEQLRRVYKLAYGVGIEKPPYDLLYLAALGRTASETFEEALEVCRKAAVKLMVVDSVGVALEGDSESARDVIEFHKDMNRFRAEGVAVLLVDHQSKQQQGDSYRGKSAFGSVYKGILARSVIQVEPVTSAKEQGKNSLTVNLRQTKRSFGPKCAPIAAKLTFAVDRVMMDAVELDSHDSGTGKEQRAREKVIQQLEKGPAYSEEIAEATGLAPNTIKNVLTDLRKEHVVEDTGEQRVQARQVRLVSPSSSLLRDEDGDTRPSPEEVFKSSFKRIQALISTYDPANSAGRGLE